MIWNSLDFPCWKLRYRVVCQWWSFLKPPETFQKPARNLRGRCTLLKTCRKPARNLPEISAELCGQSVIDRPHSRLGAIIYQTSDLYCELVLHARRRAAYQHNTPHKKEVPVCNYIYTKSKFSHKKNWSWNTLVKEGNVRGNIFKPTEHILKSAQSKWVHVWNISFNKSWLSHRRSSAEIKQEKKKKI